MADINVSVGIDPRPGEAGARVIKRSLSDVKKQADDTKGSIFNLTNALRGLVAYVSIRQLVEYADTWKLVQGRMSLVTTSTQQLNRVTKDLFDVAQRTRNSFVAVADTYTGIARATRELGVSEQTLKRITETISKTVTISGAPAASAEAALFQLRQGLAAGALRGQELNSVLEQTPRLAEAIAKGMNLTIGQLRKAGEEGKITAEKVIEALTNQAEAVDAEFAKMPLTIGQAFTMLNNSITKMVGEIDKATGISTGLATALATVAENLGTVLAIAAGVAGGIGIMGMVVFLGRAATAVWGVVGAVNALNISLLAVVGGGAIKAAFMGFVALLGGPLVATLGIVAAAVGGLSITMLALKDDIGKVGDSSLTLGESLTAGFALFALNTETILSKLGEHISSWFQHQIDIAVAGSQEIASAILAAADPSRTMQDYMNANMQDPDVAARYDRLAKYQNGPGLFTDMGNEMNNNIDRVTEMIRYNRMLAASTAGGEGGEGGGGGGGNSVTEAAKKATDQYKKLREEMTEQIADLRMLNQFYEDTPDLISEVTGDIEIMAQARKFDKNMTRAQKDELVGYLRELQKQKALSASNERIQGMKQQLDLIKAEISLQNVSEAQRKRSLTIMKAEQELRAKSAGLTEEQIQKELQLTAAIADGQAALDAAQKEREEMMKPIDNAIEGIQGAFTDAFQNIFTNGVKSFSNLGSAIKSIMINAAAQLATLWIFKSTGLAGGIGQMFGGTGGTTGVSSASAAGGSSGGGFSVGSLSSFGNLLNGGLYSQTLGSFGMGVGNTLAGYGANFVGPTQAGAIGAGAFGNLGYGAIGGLGASLFGLGGGVGGMVGNIAGSLAGGAIGTSMGTILGMAGGPVGAIIGGFLGSALGGLFGNKKPTNAAAFGNVSFDTGVASYSHMNKGNSEENMGILKSAFDQVLTFGQAFNQLGVGTIKGGITGIDMGVRDAGSAYVNGVKVTAGAGQFGQLAINALKEALKQTNITNSDVKTALSKADYSDLSELLTNVQFAANFRDNLQALSEGYSLENDIRKQAKESVKSMTDQLSEFLDKTKEIGLSTNEATAAVKAYVDALVSGIDPTKDLTSGEQAVISLRTTWDSMTDALKLAGYTAQQAAQLIETGFSNALAKTRAAFGQDIEDAILSFTDPQELAIKQLDREFETIRRNAVAYGYDLVKVEELYGLKRQQIVEQTNQSIINSYTGIKDYLDGMLLKSDSSLSESGRITEAQNQFNEALGLARSGNSDALSSITSKAETLRQLMRGYLGSGVEYANFETMLRSTLSGLLPSGYATGTNYAAPGWAMVAEQGAELVRFRGGEQVVSAGTTGRVQAEVVTELKRGNYSNAAMLERVVQIMEAQARQIEGLNSRLDRYIAAQPAAGGRR